MTVIVWGEVLRPSHFGHIAYTVECCSRDTYRLQIHGDTPTERNTE